MPFAIFTFDLTEKVVPDGKMRGKTRRTTLPDIVLWENCPAGWTYAQCIERAEHLTTQHHHTFFVLSRGADGDWEQVDAAARQRGIADVTRCRKVAAAATTARRKRKQSLTHAQQQSAFPLDPDETSTLCLWGRQQGARCIAATKGYHA
jgi:hypothetical protein